MQKSYFITDTRARRRSLGTANIPFARFSIDGQKGLVFEGGVLAETLAALNAHIESEEQSSYDGVFVLSLRRGRNGRTTPPAAPDEARQVQVTYERKARSSSPSQRDKAKQLLYELGPKFNVQEFVLIEIESDDVCPLMSPRAGTDKIFVFFGASSRGRAYPTGAAKELWEFRISDYPDYWFYHQPSGDCEVIYDNHGTPVAELIGNNLYVLYPIHDSRIENFVSIFRRILEETLLLLGTPEQREERKRQYEARMLEEVRANPVIVDHWNADREEREKFVAVAAEFAPVFGKQIHIRNHCGSARTHLPINDGNLNISIWASPGNLTNGGNISETLFGASLTSHDSSQCILEPTGEYDRLLADEDGNQFGVMVGDTIYIHYPLGSTYRLVWDDKGADALFRRMLEEIVFIKTATEKEKSARARAIAERFRVQSREGYISACNGRFEKTCATIREGLEETSKDAREYQERLVEAIREHKDFERRLEQMTSSKHGAVDAYGKEFDNLLKVPKIRDVRVRDGVIMVFTDTLYCVDPRTKKKHEIGHFRIDFHSSGGVRWSNLARKVNGKNAPHVGVEGNACLGNMSEVIPALAANYEYAALAMVCIQFVESVNVKDDWGRYINLWPVAAS